MAQLQAALSALYHDADSTVKEQASQWLENWQASPVSWTLCTEVLNNSDAGVEAHYFCANTLRSKVQREFEELPKSAVASLRESLMSLAIKFAGGPPPVRTQLCLAMAALVAHVPGAEWAQGGALSWLVSQLLPQPRHISTPLMLELLLVLPQEAGGHLASVRPERRRLVVEEMLESSPQALSVLSACLSSDVSEKTKEHVLEALAAWLRLTGPKIQLSSLSPASPLVVTALQGLQTTGEDVFFPAVDAVIELIYVTSNKGYPRPEAASLVQTVVTQVMSLRPRFHVCIQRAIAERDSAEDSVTAGVELWDGEEEAKGMARLFAEVGEAYTDLIASGDPAVAGPVIEALLDVAAHPDDSICAMSFNFWHRLTRTLTRGSHPEPLESSADDTNVTVEEHERRVRLFTPIFERLIILVRGRVKFPVDFDSWHRDDRSDFRRGRISIGDTLYDAASLVGGSRALQLLVEPLLEVSRQVSAGGAFDWRTAEAALYCIRSIYSLAPPPGDQLLLSLFQSLPNLPSTPQLQYTAALTVGAYSEWLSDTSEVCLPGAGSALVTDLLRMLSRALSEEEASSAAALSIRRLVQGCASIISQDALNSLLNLYNKIQKSGDVAENDDPALDVDEGDVREIVEAVTLAVSAVKDDVVRRSSVQRMMDVLVQPIQEILSTAVAGSDPRLPIVLPLFDRVTTLFRAVEDPADVSEALIRLWPWIEVALDRFSGDEKAIEIICKVPRNAIRTAGKATAASVHTLAAALPQRFDTSAHSAYLFVASELIKTFGDDRQWDGDLGPMFARMMVKACGALRTLQDVTNAPDIADDTFLLAGRGLNYAPRLVLTPGSLLPALLDAALAGILVQHREACGSILAFCVRLLDPATHAKCPPEALGHLQAALTPRAPLLVRLLLGGIAGVLPTSRLHEVTDVVHSLLRVGGASILQLIADAMSNVPEESVTSSDKQRLLTACHEVAVEGLGNADEAPLLAAIDEFSEVCRRNRRSAQAAQSVILPQELHYLIK